LREVQLPQQCSLARLAGLLGVPVQQLEEVLRDQLGEEVKSGVWCPRVCVLGGGVGDLAICWSGW
jgi:hypothetical protein